MTGHDAPLALHPLIESLFSRHGYTRVEPDSLTDFAADPGHALLVFTEDPLRYKETLDLVVIAPELDKAFPGRLRVGVLLPQAARKVAALYGFSRWPALVVLHDGLYVGAIDGLRDWDEYVSELGRLLAAPPTHPPSIGIAVRAPGAAGACH
jgi:hydrogenase-1 operon protein HyaE